MMPPIDPAVGCTRIPSDPGPAGSDKNEFVAFFVFEWAPPNITDSAAISKIIWFAALVIPGLIRSPVFLVFGFEFAFLLILP
jgi:hypothetical protein